MNADPVVLAATGAVGPVAEPALTHAAPRSVLATIHATFVARALYTVVRLGVVEELAAGPRSCAELAADLGVDPVALHQAVRATASTGLLCSRGGIGSEQVFALTPLGETLLDGHPSAARDLVLMMQGPLITDCAAVLPERVRTGRTGPELARGMSWFDVLRAAPAEAASFDRMMVAIHGGEYAAVANAYDLGWARSVLDVGGGAGGLAAALLAANEHLVATVFDLPDVAERAAAVLAGRGLADRCGTAAGSFFDAVPAGYDAYVLSYVLHDWDDESCVRILRNCAAAMSPTARLLLVEMVLPEGDEPHPARTLDLIMLTLTHGRERTAQEYRRLLTAAGLRLTTVLPTGSSVSVVEAVRVVPGR